MGPWRKCSSTTKRGIFWTWAEVGLSTTCSAGQPEFNRHLQEVRGFKKRFSFWHFSAIKQTKKKRKEKGTKHRTSQKSYTSPPSCHHVRASTQARTFQRPREAYMWVSALVYRVWFLGFGAQYIQLQIDGMHRKRTITSSRLQRFQIPRRGKEK